MHGRRDRFQFVVAKLSWPFSRGAAGHDCAVAPGRISGLLALEIWPAERAGPRSTQSYTNSFNGMSKESALWGADLVAALSIADKGSTH